MKPESRSSLNAVNAAIDQIADFVRGKAFSDYLSDPMLRSAVLWQFVRICEPVRQIVRDDPETALQLTGYRDIIRFRTFLIHRYHKLRHDYVWQYIQTDLPTLRNDVAALLTARN